MGSYIDHLEEYELAADMHFAKFDSPKARAAYIIDMLENMADMWGKQIFGNQSGLDDPTARLHWSEQDIEDKEFDEELVTRWYDSDIIKHNYCVSEVNDPGVPAGFCCFLVHKSLLQKPTETCKECKGSGKYVGLTVIDDCRECGGLGVVAVATPC